MHFARKTLWQQDSSPDPLPTLPCSGGGGGLDRDPGVCSPLIFCPFAHSAVPSAGAPQTDCGPALSYTEKRGLKEGLRPLFCTCGMRFLMNEGLYRRRIVSSPEEGEHTINEIN